MAASSVVRAGLPVADDAISGLLATEIDQARISPGLVVGLLDQRGRRIVSHGRADANASVRLNGATVFDIGSVTKLFTALTLADMVVRGEMTMNDPLQEYLPPGAHAPDFEGRPITLLDVATYSPGLPGWPPDMPALSATKPFPEYSVEQLYGALATSRLDAAPGTHYVYSNFGYGLLALALARRADMDFESLVMARVCKPLGMDSTRITLTPAMQRRYTPGHGLDQAPVQSWNIPAAFVGAASFHSTADDLLRFLAAAAGIHRSPLAPAFSEMMRITRPCDIERTRVAAGWFITSAHGDQLIWKDGNVLGYSSYLGYSRGNRTGVVVLLNGTAADTIGLGGHLLNTDFPLHS